jgi:hypothetical protein
MTRRSRALAGGLIALAAIAATAVVAAPAGAHTPATFKLKTAAPENSKITSRQDGTGAQSIHKITIPSVGNITCFEPDFKGTVTQELNTEITLTTFMYGSCKLESNDALVLFHQNHCQVRIGANGEMEIEPMPEEVCNGEEEPMELEIKETGCIVDIPPQTFKSGLGFTTITNGTMKEVTMTMLPIGIEGFRGKKCATEGAFTTGEYRTGNTILGGFEDRENGAAVPMEWLATVP